MSMGEHRSITVILVCEGRAVAETLATRLADDCDRLDPLIAEVDGALDRLVADDVDCVVTAPELADADGLRFLERTRERRPDLPALFCAEPGSEADARNALAAGATDYHLHAGPDSALLLANRIRNAVDRSPSERTTSEDGERFGRLLEHAADYVIILDADATIRYASPSIEGILGFSPSDICGSSALEFVHPDDRGDVEEAFARMRRDPKTDVSVSLRARHREGSWRWLDIRGRNLLADPEIGGLVVNLRDITERKANTETLRSLHEATRDLLTAPTRTAVSEQVVAIARDVIDLPHASVFLWDEADELLRAKAINQENRELFGDPPAFERGEGIVGHVFDTGEPVFLDDAQPDDRALDREEASDWIRSYVAVRLGSHGVFTVASPEVGVFDRDGFEIANILAANAAVALDQLIYKQELARQRDLFARAQAIGQVGAWEYDPSSDLLTWSEEVCRIFDLPDGETSPDALIDYFHSDDGATLMEAFRRAVGNGDQFDLELRLRTDDSVQPWVRIRGDPKREDGRVLRVRGTINAITEKKETERHLDVLDRLLRHNLRNEMTVVRGLAETIEAETEGSIAEMAGQIVEGSDTLLGSVEKEREIVKILTGSSNRRRVDISDRVRKTVAAAETTYPEASIAVTGPTGTTAMADENVSKALDELVENAIVHCDDPEPRVELTVEETETAVVVSVADNGPGIPDHDRQVIVGQRDIHDLFHGSGIGLWLVDWIVRRSNGSLEIEDGDPRGTVVTIELPRD